MIKAITIFEGEGDPLLLQDTGEGKVSVAFLLEDNLFDYAYYHTASKLLHQPNTIHLTNYKITPINEEPENLPQHLQFEALLLFNTNPKMAIKFFKDLQKLINWPLNYDELDYYLLATGGGLQASEATLLTEDLIHSINNKQTIEITSPYGKPEEELVKYFNGEDYELTPHQINSFQTYPIDYIYKDGLLYEFNYHTGKLKEIDKIKTTNKNFSTDKSIITLVGDELVIIKNNKITTDKLVSIDYLNGMVILYGMKDLYQLTPFTYRITFSKPTSNYYLRKFLLENFETTPEGIKFNNIIIPKRFNNTINPTHLMKLNHYTQAPNNIVRNYSYIIITPTI